MKRLFLLAILASLMIVMAGCSGKEESATTTEQQTILEETILEETIIQEEILDEEYIG